MDIYARPGSKVIFLGEGGTEYDRNDARNWLKVGWEYTVERVNIGNFRSSVALEGIPGSFNTVMFSDANRRERLIVDKVINLVGEYPPSDYAESVDRDAIWAAIELDLKNGVFD